MVDVIPHATTGGRAPGSCGPCSPRCSSRSSVFAVALWGWWLHPAGVLTPALAGAAGVVLVVLLLTPPRAWAGALVAGALATAGAAAWHDAPVELVVGQAVAVTGAAFVAAALLRWYASGPFHLTRVRELCTLVAAAAVGGVLGAALQTLGDRDRARTRREPSCGASPGRRPSRSARAW